MESIAAEKVSDILSADNLGAAFQAQSELFERFISMARSPDEPEVVKRNLKSAGSIDSDIVRAILRIQALSGQRSLWLKIISDLNIYFVRNEKKNQSRSKVWMGCIH